MLKKLLAVSALATMAMPVLAKDGPTLCFSHYTGWEPVAYIDHAGLMPEGNVQLYGDYVESINAFTNGDCDAVTVTNMDALAFPALSGVDTTFIVVGDTSDGNDALLVKGADDDFTAADLAGRDVLLMELTVSHYLLARYLEINGMSERDLQVVGTSDGEIGPIFVAQDEVVVATWNPIVISIIDEPGARVLFTSAEIPGEIIDGIVMRTDAPEADKMMIATAWNEAMKVMSGQDTAAADMIAYMADYAGSTVGDFERQLETTAMIYTPAEMVDFLNNPQLAQTMEFVRQFSFDSGIFGDAASPDEVGIQLPDGTVLGDPDNIMLRFDDSFAKRLAASEES